MTREALLVVNAGSSSLKFQLYDPAGDPPARLLKGQIDGIAVRPRLRTVSADGGTVTERDFSPAGRGPAASRRHSERAPSSFRRSCDASPARRSRSTTLSGSARDSTGSAAVAVGAGPPDLAGGGGSAPETRR
jgi:hypothetical protein